MKKGWLNRKDGQDRAARGPQAAAPKDKDRPTASSQAPRAVAQSGVSPGQPAASELRRAGDLAAEKGHAEAAAESYVAALRRSVAHDREAPAAALASHVEALLRAHCVHDAERTAAMGLAAATSDGDSSDLGRWRALVRRCEAAGRQAVDAVAQLKENPGAPPIPALLQLLRSGVEDPKLWRTLAKAATPFFEEIAGMLQESGTVVLDGLLVGQQSIDGPPAGTLEVVVFPDATWQGGHPVNLPRDQLACNIEHAAAEQLGLPRDNTKLQFWGGGMVSDGFEDGALPWPCARCGDWLRANGNAGCPETTLPQSASWPQLRCAREMVVGGLERGSMEQAIEVVKKQRPALIASAHLLPAAESKWSVEFLQESIPSGTADSSAFSVYRAASSKRTFRYADEDTSTGVYDVQMDQSADRHYMSFSDFAQKKQACASGEGDGWAYYLWGIALRRTAGGDYEGCNFGQAVDEQLTMGPHWETLERLREEASWGSFRQAQVFIGCRNALTPCHYDLVHNAYAQVSGWKRFVLLDPGYGPCLYPYPVAHPMDRCARVDLERPDFKRFPRLRSARAVEAVLGPGDALVIPAGWWHHVQTLTEDSVSVSFWFEHSGPGRGGRGGGALSPLSRVMLMREVEQLMERILGARCVRSALGQLRGMLGGEAPKPSPEEVLPCAFILWRLARVLGPLGARRFVHALADDERFAELALKQEARG